jgi:hypothetical protein
MRAYYTTVRYFNHDGEDITFFEWCQLMEMDEYRTVRFTSYADAWVSTIWLGISITPPSMGMPTIFETMTFASDGDALATARTHTYAEAVAAHEEACEVVVAAMQRARSQLN